MASNKRLKAFVRFDGSGRVVPSSLILQRFKPKVGNWLEIPANECCNYTTTTTTTSGPLAFRLLFNSIESADLIVGDSSNVNDWNTFMDLPTLGTPFTSVSVVGSEVFLYGGSGIKVKPGLMYTYTANTFLIAINDEAESITSVGGDAFSYCYGLTDVNLPVCTIVYGWQDSPFQDWGGFGECTALVNLNIPLLTEAGDSAFRSFKVASLTLPLLSIGGYGSFESSYLTTVNFPLLVNIPPQFFNSNTGLTTINIPACTNLGGTIANNTVFNNIVGKTISLQVNPAVFTDPDLVELSLANTITSVNNSPYVPFTGNSGDLNLEFDNISNVPVANANSVSDWNTFFDLPSWSTPFLGVSVVGNIVTLTGGQNIAIKKAKFKNNINIISIIDTGCVVWSSAEAFNFTSALTSADLPNLVYIGINGFSVTNLTNVNFPKVIVVDSVGLNNVKAFTLSLPMAILVNANSFTNLSNITVISLPVCEILGQNCLNNGVFAGVTGKVITLTVPAALMTCNTGNPDGDIQYLQANNTVTIVTV